MNEILLWFAKLAYGKKLLELVHGLNGAMSGRRSEILLALVAVLELLKQTNLLPSETVNPITTALLGALPITLAEKAGKIIGQVESVLPKPAGNPGSLQ